MTLSVPRSLWQLELSEFAWISGFASDLDERFLQRFQELGFQVGERICCVRRSPFGGPKVFEISKTMFSLGAEDAQHIYIQSTGDIR